MYSEDVFIPSLGRGVVDCVVAGRGLCAFPTDRPLEEAPPYTLPMGGNRTIPTLFYSSEQLYCYT